MFEFKIVDRESYNNLIDLCNKVLAKNDEVLFMASKINKFNEELIKSNEKILKHNDKIIDFNENLLNHNGLSAKKENKDAEN